MSYVSLNLIWGKGVSCEKLSQGWVAGNGHGGESRGIVTGVGYEELSREWAAKNYHSLHPRFMRFFIP